MTMIHQPDRGDKLASGAKSATFPAPKINQQSSEAEMMDSLHKLTPDEFIEKFRITRREYDWFKAAANAGNEERVSDFAKDIQTKQEGITRALAADDQQDTSLSRECFITPRPGSVIVNRDVPLKPKSKILMPPKKDRQRELLPTTGHVIKVGIGADFDYYGGVASHQSLQGKRVLFQQMSGQAICFTGYPTWIELTAGEIMGIVEKEDAEVVDVPLEGMV